MKSKQKRLSVRQPWAFLLCAGVKDVEGPTLDVTMGNASTFFDLGTGLLKPQKGALTGDFSLSASNGRARVIAGKLLLIQKNSSPLMTSC